MIPLRVTALIDAPDGAVRRVLGRTDIWTRAARAAGGRTEVVGGRTEVLGGRAGVVGDRAGVVADRAGERAPLRTGELIRVSSDRSRPAWLSRLLPRRTLILSTTVTAGLPRFDLLAGAPSFCRIGVSTAGTGAGTLVTVDCQLSMRPRLRTPLYRRRILAAGQLLLGIVRLAAAQTQIVVAGVIIDDGRLLAARRTYPAELAGRWELPGGKVNPGESEELALIRELAEELGIEVTVGERVGSDVDLGDNHLLRCRRAYIRAGRPNPTEHDVLQWVAPTELDGLDWLPADRDLLPSLRKILALD